MNAAEFFIQVASGPFAPFALMLFLAAFGLITAALVGLHDLVERGLRRRHERLNAWSADPSTITDREIESLR